MRAVVQRVTSASVTVATKNVAEIQAGLLILIGIEDADTAADCEWLTAKIANLRIFEDHNKVMNVSVKDIDGEVLIVSQFTLMASTKKGNRPSYIKASKSEVALPLYDYFAALLETECNKKIKKGIFGADMKVALVNDGPVTIFIDTKNKE